MHSVTKINYYQPFQKPKRLRVAAYCRVSTDSEEQQTSLDTQRLHYENYIKANAEWEFAGVYYDEGITGTKKDIRKGLMTLISDCKKGKIDLILTKSISRFCRNLTDCLELFDLAFNRLKFIRYFFLVESLCAFKQRFQQHLL